MPRKGRFGGNAREIALINLLKEKVVEKFGPSGAVLSLASGNQWDLAIMKMKSRTWQKVVLVEAKTSGKNVYYLSHDKEQHAMYLKYFDDLGTDTWYAFRLVPKQGCMKLGNEAAYWKFFSIEAAKGKLTWEDGISLDEFLDRIDEAWYDD